MKSFIARSKKGFTVIELVISVAIFVFMTALMIAKYSNFDQSVLLTDVAYDTALTIRTAQAYGTSVKGAGTTVVSFQNAYGVHFDTGSPTQMILYADTNGNGRYDAGSGEEVSTFTPKRGATIGGVCVGSSAVSCTPASGVLDVYFKRPDPSAVICSASSCSNAFGEVIVKSAQGDTRAVSIYQNGEISVQN